MSRAVARALFISLLLGILYVSVFAFLGNTKTVRLLGAGAVIAIFAFASQTIDRIYGPKEPDRR